MQFRFISGTTISTQNDVRLLRNGEALASWSEDSGWDGVGFQSLLNVCVTSYGSPDERHLHIQFQNGLVLEFIDDDRQYEAMQIYSFGDVNKVIVI